MNVSVLGLGYIGLPTSIVLALNGHKVKGFDVSGEVVASLNEGHIHIAVSYTHLDVYKRQAHVLLRGQDHR